MMSDMPRRIPAAPVTRYVHGLFCEDVREELGGTASYVGVFQQAVLPTAPYPIVMPKIAIVFWVVCQIEDKINDLDGIFLEIPGDQRIDMPQIDFPSPPETTDARYTRRTATGILRAANFVVPQAGILRLKLRVWGQLWTAVSLDMMAADMMAADMMAAVQPDPPVSGRATGT